MAGFFGLSAAIFHTLSSVRTIMAFAAAQGDDGMVHRCRIEAGGSRRGQMAIVAAVTGIGDMAGCLGGCANSLAAMTGTASAGNYSRVIVFEACKGDVVGIGMASAAVAGCRGD